MKDLRVLYLGRNEESRLTCQTRHLREELSKHVKVFPYGKDWGHPRLGKPRVWEKDVAKIARVFKPDIIFISLYFHWFNFDRVDCPSFYWVSVPHFLPFKRAEWINKNRVDVTLHECYGNSDRKKAWGMKKLSKLFFKGHRAVFFPQSVNLDIFKDYGLERFFDVALLGKTGRPLYPLRVAVRDWLETVDLKIFCRKRPRFDYGWTKEKLARNLDVLAEESYARAISQCKVFPTGTSVHRYPVSKIFEGMATNTLMLTNPPLSPEMYHLEPNHNFVEINQNNFRGRILKYVWCESERRKIARRGYEMVRKHHDVKVRVKQLVELMEESLS